MSADEHVAHIFLCYARENEQPVAALYDSLSDAGFKPWMDIRDLLPGEAWEARVEGAIRECDFFVACLSHSATSKRGFVQRELNKALDIWREKLVDDIYLIPARLEDCSVPESLSRFQWVDMFKQDGFHRLKDAIRIGMRRKTAEAGSPHQEALQAAPLRSAGESVEVTLRLGLPYLDERNRRLLQYAIAAFLALQPEDVKIILVEKGSVRVTIELPKTHGLKLLRALKDKDADLTKWLAPLALLELAESTRGQTRKGVREPVNITVYGSPVMELIVEVGRSALNTPNVQAMNQIAKIGSDGTIEFRPDSYIVVHVFGQACVFGPLNAGGSMGPLRPSVKVPVPFSVGASQSVRDSAAVAELTGPMARLGGQSANVLMGFFDLFQELTVQFIATTETEASRASLNALVRPLAEKLGIFDPIELHEYPRMALAIVGPATDGITLVAQPTEEAPVARFPTPLGKVIMVTTLYSPAVALDALAHASYGDRLAVLALTRALCSKNPIPEEVLKRTRATHPELFNGGASIQSVYDFVRQVVLPKGRCVCIMDEDELKYLTGMELSAKVSYRLTSLGDVVRALRQFRRLQHGSRHRVYVTVGRSGSFVLTEDDHLIHCAVYTDVVRVPTNMIGVEDTYATFVLALEAIGNYVRPFTIPAADVVRVAAAGADACFYHGFGNLSVEKVNWYVGDGTRLVVDLGPINSIAFKRWDVLLEEMRDSDYRSIGNVNMGTPSPSLQEVIGRAFLKI
jgi:hypothetical protein